jgi:hypothetical protein
MPINPYTVIGLALIGLMAIPASMYIAFIVARVIATWGQKL